MVAVVAEGGEGGSEGRKGKGVRWCTYRIGRKARARASKQRHSCEKTATATYIFSKIQRHSSYCSPIQRVEEEGK